MNMILEIKGANVTEIDSHRNRKCEIQIGVTGIIKERNQVHCVREISCRKWEMKNV